MSVKEPAPGVFARYETVGVAFHVDAHGFVSLSVDIPTVLAMSCEPMKADRVAVDIHPRQAVELIAFLAEGLAKRKEMYPPMLDWPAREPEAAKP